MPRYKEELIDKNALMEALLDYTWRDEEGFLIESTDEKRQFIEQWLPNVPIVDAEPVRHGHWIEHHEPYTWMGYTYWSCSECGFECGYEKDIKFRTNHCPNCGAKMDEVKNNEL